MQEETSLKIFSGNSNNPLAREICQYLEIDIGDALVTTFPDRKVSEVNENIRGADDFLFNRPPSGQPTHDGVAHHD